MAARKRSTCMQTTSLQCLSLQTHMHTYMKKPIEKNGPHCKNPKFQRERERERVVYIDHELHMMANVKTKEDYFIQPFLLCCSSNCFNGSLQRSLKLCLSKDLDRLRFFACLDFFFLDQQLISYKILKC